MAIVLVFGLLLWLLPATAVYVHAQNRNRDALLWAAVTLVAGVLGFFLYVLFGERGREPAPVRTGHADGNPAAHGDAVWCLDCNSQNPAHNDYCHACQSPLKVVCNGCGRRNLRENENCSTCGGGLARASLPS